MKFWHRNEDDGAKFSVKYDTIRPELSGAWGPAAKYDGMREPHMFNFLIFIIGAALMFGMGVRSVLARRRLQTKGEKVTARVAGIAQGRDGQAYVLEFETAGGSHRLHYPKAAKGKGFAAGETVTLYYDPEDPEKMYVEGDRAVLGAEVLYFALAVVLVLLMAGFVR